MKTCICLVAVLVLLTASASAGIFADFHDDFQGPAPATGWQYLWNSGGAIDNPANYVPLLWEGVNSRYDVDGVPGLPGPDPGAWVYLGSTGGHPGRGVNQGAGVDRHAIAAYTIQPGDLSPHSNLAFVTGSSFYCNGGCSNGLDLWIGRDGQTPVHTQFMPKSASTQQFDVPLGQVHAGDTVYVALGPHLTDGCDGFSLDFSLSNGDVADYRADFQGGTPKDGWQYLWNANGPIGTPANYVPLAWDGSRYELDADTTFPDSDPAAYLSLHGTGGHPGRGSAQTGAGNDLDRYPIAAYTVPFDGFYLITDSLLSVGSTNGEVDLLVHVNGDAPIYKTLVAGGTGTTFDLSLGALQGGDTVYVAVGPHVYDYSDSFSLDFTITAWAPEPSALALAALGLPVLVVFSRRRRR